MNSTLKLNNLKKIHRGTLSEQIIERLLDFIEDNGLKPGDPLPATIELAEHFGVSRTVIREALKFLEGRGLIEIVNGKKPMLKTITVAPLVDFFDQIAKLETEALHDFMEIRQELEIQSAKLAARRRNSEELQLMKDAVATMQQNLNDIETFGKLDMKFHLLIAQASHNNMMKRLIKSIQKTLKHIPAEQETVCPMLKSLEAVQSEHAMILEAIERGDPDRASAAMETHLGEKNYGGISKCLSLS